MSRLIANPERKKKVKPIEEDPLKLDELSLMKKP